MKSQSFLLLLAIGGTSMPSCALPPVVDRSGYVTPPAEAAPPPAQAPSSNQLYQIISRIDQLEQEVRDLTGKLEEQAYQNAELKKRLSTMYSDFDERMQGLENKVNAGGSSPSADSAEQPAPSSESGSAPAEETPPVSEQAAPETNAAKPSEPPTTDTSAPAAASSGIPEPPHAESAQPQPEATAAAPAKAQQQQESPKVSEAENQQFRQAYDALRNGRTAQSIDGFKAFLDNYPSSQLVAEAQYWMGEGYRVNQDSDNARKAFNTVIENHPNSAKVPDALLKLGYIEIDLNNKTKANDYLNQVVNNYPNSTAARHAAKKLDSLNTR